MLLPVLTPDESRAWDALAEQSGIALATLMETAGRAVLQVLLRAHPASARQGVLIAAGTGHNGGDGWVLARALHRQGVPVWVAPLRGEPAPLAAHMARLARQDGVRELEPDGPWPGVGVAVDAILGTGARGAPRPDAQALVDRLSDLSLPLVAIDGPTGIDLGTGVSHAAASAGLTVTFGGVRRGHLLARDEMGDIAVVDIGHPSGAPAWPRLVSDALAAERIGTFSAREHKGTRGRVVVVGGDAGMSGAARLAGRAAFAAGAGLVHVVAEAGTIDAVRAAEPDLQTLVHPLLGDPGAELEALLDRADAVVVGPGLGRGEGKAAFVLRLLALARAAVVDADALMALEGHVDRLAQVASGRPVVLTPHAGEFRALFPALAADRDTDPWAVAQAAAGLSHATVLLKGVPTVVAGHEPPLLTVAAGNPGLATGGSGDVLSGLIAAQLARGMDAQVAAAIGAQCLGGAADLAARRVTARAMRPMDVVAALPDLWRGFDGLRRAGGEQLEPPVLAWLPRPERT